MSWQVSILHACLLTVLKDKLFMSFRYFSFELDTVIDSQFEWKQITQVVLSQMLKKKEKEVEV